MAATELRRRQRDRSLLITAIGAPFLLALIMGFAFKPSASGALVRVGLVDNAATPAARAVVDAGLQAAALSPEMGVVRFASDAAMKSALGSGQIEAGVVVPVAFARPGLVRAGDLPVTQVKPNSTLAGPAAQVLVGAIEGRLGAGRLAALAAGAEPTPADKITLTTEMIEAAAQPPVVAYASESLRRHISLVGYFAPSMAIVFLFFGASGVARSVLAERQSGTMARLAAAPVRGSAVAAGKILGLLLVSLVGLFVLWGATTFAFGADWGRPGPVAVMCLISAVSISALALLVVGFARDQGQADSATLVLGLVLALLGGNFFPPGGLPTFFADLSRATPNGWALQGFGSLSLDGGGWSAVVGPTIALALISAVCAVIAGPRLRSLLVPR